MSGPGGFQPSFRITHRMTAGLTRIERARGFLEAARLSEELQRDLRDLVQQGVVKSIGAARSVRYILQIKRL